LSSSPREPDWCCAQRIDSQGRAPDARLREGCHGQMATIVLPKLRPASMSMKACGVESKPAEM
jgi:hypothetical protein